MASNVTLVEMLPTVLPLEDADVGGELEKALKKQKINVRTGTRMEKVDASKGQVMLTLSREGATETLTAEKVLMSIGVAPNSENIGLESVGVQTERGFIKIDDQMRTSVPGIYAIGDVTGKLLLAHVASAQGIVAAEAIAGRETEALNYSNCRVACTPIRGGQVGLSEAQAREMGHAVKLGQFPFRANGKAVGLNDYDGFVKVVADEEYNELLGVHIIARTSPN